MDSRTDSPSPADDALDAPRRRDWLEWTMLALAGPGGIAVIVGLLWLVYRDHPAEKYARESPSPLHVTLKAASIAERPAAPSADADADSLLPWPQGVPSYPGVRRVEAMSPSTGPGYPLALNFTTRDRTDDVVHYYMTSFPDGALSRSCVPGSCYLSFSRRDTKQIFCTVAADRDGDSTRVQLEWYRERAPR